MISKKFVKVVVFAIVVFFVVSSLAPAQMISERKKADVFENDFEIEYTVTFSADDFLFDKLMGYDTVELKDGTCINDVGKPMMPAKEIKIALPAGMAVKEVRVVDTKSVEVKGEYNVFPAQPPRRTDGSDDDTPFVEPDLDTYNSKDPYPDILVEFTYQTDLAGQGMAAIWINPLQYIPCERKLTLYTSITFVITGVNGYECGSYLSSALSDVSRESYEWMVKGMVINPKDVELRTPEVPPQTLYLEPGNYDYIIISPTSWASYYQSLADWKTKKGVPAKIVTLSNITSWYGDDGKEEIRDFIIDAYYEWGAIYFLLGGDTSYIPYHTRTFYSVDPEPVPSDTYYACLGSTTNDWTCDVHVGRASVTGPGSSNGKIGNFINKIITYETDPPMTNYAKRAALFGFDLDYTTDGEDCKIDIDNLYIPSGWSVTTVYDSDSGNHEDYVDSAVNSGQNLINHIDHCGEYFIGTGYTNHGGAGLSTGEVDAFYNGDKQSIFYSIGCWPCAYDYSNCIAEHFVRDTNGGGVAFVGNSRYGIYAVGYDDYYSLRFDRYFFRSLFQQYSQNEYILGRVFSDHKNDAYANPGGGTDPDVYKYLFTGLTLLGDPELPIWTENPSTISVTHPSTLPTGTSAFLVDTNIPYVYICLWKDGDVYMTATANSAGDYTFYPDPTTSGTMYVTVTKHNYLPYEGSAAVVVGNNPPNTPTNAFPIDGATDVSIDAVLVWNGGDPDIGDTVTYAIYFEADNPNPGYYDTTPEYAYWETPIIYDLPTLDYNTHYYWKIIAEDNHGETATSEIWDFTTEEESNQAPNTPSTPDGPTPVYAGYSREYSTSATDPEGHQIFYKWNWGDEETGWLGPHVSGELVTELHAWTNPGDYNVKVKAKDDPDGDGDHSDGLESSWSDLLSVEVRKPGDASGDDIVNVDDLLILLSAWGPNPGHPADFNGDDMVDVNDLLILLANWD